MSFDRAALAQTVATHGAVARVVVAEVKGSTPREVGAAMHVWSGGQSGTIGGGTLEYEAVATAQLALANGSDRLDRIPLGPALGQCCGGAVTLLTEVWDMARLDRARGPVLARPAPGHDAEDMPFSVRTTLSKARAAGSMPAAGLLDGWMVEPVLTPSKHVWLYGAGHVGRAIATTLAPLPEVLVTWIDTGTHRFPDDIPPQTERLVAANPADAAGHAPEDAHHLILTYSHALDLELCHRILGQPFASCGLIGSQTKWARFRTRLAQLGHNATQIDRITCPIGDPALGKHPQAIAVGVAAGLLSTSGQARRAQQDTG